MDCFTARFYEGIHHLPSGCDPFPLPMAEGSQGVWEMVMAQPQHVQSSTQIPSYNIPKILELDLQRVQFPQQHPWLSSTYTSSHKGIIKGQLQVTLMEKHP
ncbi:UNVERIFIED_CONTAM: hypothetical protein FKN15_059098 [Acipenser sinensis]